MLAAALKSLIDRGISNPQQFADLGVEAIEGTCRWFDAQSGRVGTGVLVHELRAGGKPNWSGPSSSSGSELLKEQVRYGDEIQAWLCQHFPECGPHPAAIAAVVRMHFLYGKGRLTVTEHGAEIRGAVARWEGRWGKCL